MNTAIDASATEVLQVPTDILRGLMNAVGIKSFRALSQQAGVSDWAIQRLRQGAIAQMRLETLQKIAGALRISLATLLEHFGVAAGEAATSQALQDVEPSQDSARIAALEAEYQRLQTQLAQQTIHNHQSWQRETLAVLEPWLLQWPTVVNAVAQNPELPASRLVPLVQPVMDLLEQWEIEAIAPIGSEVLYDPQHHQLMEGIAEPGDTVRVRYAGYRQRDTLLHRAKVSPVGTAN